MVPENQLRADLRAKGRLTVAMYDFDLSVILSSAHQRLPYQFSWVGIPPHPFDIAQGEYDYDPFAFDVALLGIVFLENLEVIRLRFIFSPLGLGNNFVTVCLANGTSHCRNDHHRHPSPVHCP